MLDISTITKFFNNQNRNYKLNKDNIYSKTSKSTQINFNNQKK